MNFVDRLYYPVNQFLYRVGSVLIRLNYAHQHIDNDTSIVLHDLRHQLSLALAENRRLNIALTVSNIKLKFS